MSSTSLRPFLEKRKAELQREIAAAASAGDDSMMLTRTDDFRAIAAVLSRYEDADREAAKLQKFLMNGGAVPSPASRASASTASSRQLGVRARAEFVERATTGGLLLKLDRGSIYRTTSGRRVGTAVATERHNNRWFLGLGEDSFDAAVLLCVPNNGTTMAICLPQSFFALHGRYLSRAGGQVKFNVARRGADMILKIPRMTPEHVNEFIDAIAGLEK